jgi:hypothetical protein
MQRAMAVVIGLGCVIVMAVFVPIALAGVAGVALLGGAWWLLARCRHRDRLGLLPPTTLADGTRLSARWYCDECGKTWTASFDRDTAPVVKFTGYDQSKAPAAARHAAELRERQQAAAVRRAGYAVRRVPGRAKTAESSPLVAFEKARARVAR